MQVLQSIKAKAGMRLDAQGFAIYLILGNSGECGQYIDIWTTIVTEEALLSLSFDHHRLAAAPVSRSSLATFSFIKLSCRFTENCVENSEHLADSLHLWESWAKTSGSKDLKFICKVSYFF